MYKHFVLSFSDGTGRTGDRRYFLPNVQVEYYNVMTDGQDFFNQPVKSDIRSNDTIPKIATGQGDDYKTGYLLDYPYFKHKHKIIR